LLATRAGFGLAFDAGIEIGAMPGARLYLALQGLVETGGDILLAQESNYLASSPNGSVLLDGALVAGTRPSLTLGPAFGVRFGH